MHVVGVDVTAVVVVVVVVMEIQRQSDQPQRTSCYRMRRNHPQSLWHRAENSARSETRPVSVHPYTPAPRCRGLEARHRHCLQSDETGYLGLEPY